MIILEENFKWHLQAFASELFIYIQAEVEVAFSAFSSLNKSDLQFQCH